MIVDGRFDSPQYRGLPDVRHIAPRYRNLQGSIYELADSSSNIDTELVVIVGWSTSLIGLVLFRWFPFLNFVRGLHEEVEPHALLVPPQECLVVELP